MVVVVVATALAIPTPASGSDDTTTSTSTSTSSSTTGIQFFDHSLLVEVGFRSELSETRSFGPTSGRSAYCGWFEMAFGGFSVLQLAQVIEPEIGVAYVVYCWDGLTDEILPRYPKIKTYDPNSGFGRETADPFEVALYAVGRIDFEAPSVVMNPPGTQLVGIPTWFGVTSRVHYDPVSAAAGPVWAAVRPVLRNVTFRFDDGDSFVCGPSDATALWDPNGPRGDCSYTFDSNGDGSVRMWVTAIWTIWQRTNRNPTEHYWGSHRRTTAVNVNLRELQAVINRPSCCRLQHRNPYSQDGNRR